MSASSHYSRSTIGLFFCAFGAIIALFACVPDRNEALDPSTMPEDVRADYAVFAQRCSKCHSLSRPLTATITDDEEWVRYVNRMRRQPGSGITRADQVPILRFLHYYTQHRLDAGPPPPTIDLDATVSAAVEGGGG